MVSALIFGLIDKSKVSDKFKIMAVDMYTKALRDRGYDITIFSEKFKEKYNEEE